MSLPKSESSPSIEPEELSHDHRASQSTKQKTETTQSHQQPFTSNSTNMSAVGTIEPFDIAHPENWTTYYARFELFLQANDVQSSGRQKAIFLTLAGAPLYDLLSSLASPQTVSDLSLSVIKTTLTNHFSPRPSEIASFYKFHKRDQMENESFAEYVAALRKLAVDCNFGNALDRMLRDRLVCGLHDESLQRSFLAETDLQLQKVIDRACVAEAASKNLLVIRQPEQVHRIGDSKSQQQKGKKPKNQRNQTKTNKCNGCGADHPRSQCPHKETICNACGIKGHLQRVCRSTQSNDATSDTHVRQQGSQREQNAINQLKSTASLKKSATIYINGRACKFEIDSGSDYTIVSSRTLSHLWPTHKPRLNECNLNLRDFQNNVVPIQGVIDVDIEYHKQIIKDLPLLVVDGGQSNVLGWNWFEPLGISVQGVHAIQESDCVSKVVARFEHLFCKELGKFTGEPVTLQLKDGFQPIRLPARRIPISIRSLVETEIDRLCNQGILEAVEYSNWATPIVPVLKSDNTIRICGDYKSTLNKAILPHNFQIPPITSLLSSIEGGKIFAKLDLAQAYQQLVVDEQSALLQTLITHKGAFKVNRLQFGISSAPGIFQNFIEKILCNIPGVLPYFDDIVIMGKTEVELSERLNEVLKRFSESGLHLRRDKCSFGVSTIQFLGFTIDSFGIRPSFEKLKSIQSAPSPKDKKQLQAFLGLLNFYHSFLPDKATIAEPLHRLLDKNCPFLWKREHQTSFDELKQLLTSDSVLMHYDDKLPLLLVCDASPYGLGAVLSHKLPDDTERPIAFYSRTLSKAERNYSQIDREATAIIAGVKKFHDYVYGRRFTLVTDHRPLLGIFRTNKPTPAIMSTVMLRRCIFLNAYNFDFVHREGRKMGNADCLSRLPLENEEKSESKREVLMIDMASTPIFDANEVAKQSSKDPIITKVLSWALRGWPPSVTRDDPAYPYVLRRCEITTLRGCLLWGNRTVIPPPSRQSILHALHSGHHGIVKMKALARSYVWWPGIDAEIESMVKRCVPCQETRHEKPQAAVHLWESTKTAWSRLHIDFAGPVQGKQIFIVVDSYSKWLEAHIVNSTTSQAAIKSLRSLFATHGLPDMIVSDNGTAFTSGEFKEFVDNNLIRHVRCAPFHPSTNGPAERMVQTTKDFLKKMPACTQSAFELNLIRFVFSQHINAHASTGVSPAELLFNRKLKTYFDKVHPREQSSKTEDATEQTSFGVGDLVWARNYAAGEKWFPGCIVGITGPISYKIRLEDNRIIKRHLDQIRARVAKKDVDTEQLSFSGSGSSSIDSDTPSYSAHDTTIRDSEYESASSPSEVRSPSHSPPISDSSRARPPIVSPSPRRSKRSRKIPDYYSASAR